MEFLDKDGKVKNVFQTGEDLSVRVYFKQNKPIKVLNFGIAIYNQEGVYLLGINTFWDKIDTKKYLKNGYFDIKYIEIPLKTNTYYINLAIYGEKYEKICNFVTRAKDFKVFSRDKRHGAIDLKYKWM